MTEPPEVTLSRRPIRLIGLPTDINSSFLRGPAKGPAEIRKALWSEHGNAAAENGLELGEEIQIADEGDLPLREEPADDALIEAAVIAAARAGHLPLMIGGDHCVTAAVVKALAKVHGPLNVLHFDAHADLYEALDGNPRSHASPFARIMEAGAACRLVQVGIRTLNRHQREQAERFGVEIIPMVAFTPDAVPVLEPPLYVSIDLDGFDPSIAPGVSHHEPGGFTVREVLATLARQTARLVGADVVELNPDRDLNGVTAVVAAKLVKEIAALPGAA
jgi:agmatinase